ncbi:MAG: hypothetical protein L0G39_10475 [Chryseobacterium sp.]|uniref:hypothetical protein n=1 Tax=Acinetobacter guillouiae TaxID=106649 RepID=UPI0002D04DCE|nr:hypothetical protein [Acinetobacter guillouiae]MDN5477347.1 hypothetical protein [Chryseobacterium sp.]MDN5487874.1 hypothetical protein [Lactococcus lactis]MDN5650151.1 hypothetical protein [Acinetobacter sp.]MDN5695317.1 hypothetical protein [Staphylococcus equorum]ENU59643.1 hypothetical protein F981_01741 [Acinetobacter guillouiae CIP 63.46]
MKKVVFFVLLVSQLVFAGNVLASTYIGKVKAINVRDETGLIWVYISGERTGNRPNCATNWYMVIKNENSPTGKRQLAMLMMAIATNKTVAIPGAETCTRWADGEDISIVGVER